MNFKNLLVPIDGSDYSLYALQQAIDMAEKFDAKIHLIYVKYPNVPAVDSYLLDDVVESMNKYTDAILNNAANKVPEKFKGKKVLEVGTPADRILDFAKNNDIDLIIIAAKGLGLGIGGRIFGSVSQSVIQNAQCAVFVCQKDYLKDK